LNLKEFAEDIRVEHMVPNQNTGIFEFEEEREGEVFCFQRLAEASIGAASRKLKMRRLPPTTLTSHKYKAESCISLQLQISKCEWPSCHEIGHP
jgi:hypothetical protein